MNQALYAHMNNKRKMKKKEEKKTNNALEDADVSFCCPITYLRGDLIPPKALTIILLGCLHIFESQLYPQRKHRQALSSFLVSGLVLHALIHLLSLSFL
jgi:hypothetical protein